MSFGYRIYDKRSTNDYFFREASDWEAKFYQIQSKYLLLLNELHNPQVGVSASRQEMVSQLLKDVIEAAETRSGPLASTKSDSENGISKSKNVSYDRFGFRIDIGMSTDSMEEKVEKLRKQAESQLQNQTAEKEEIAQVNSNIVHLLIIVGFFHFNDTSKEPIHSKFHIF